MIALRIALILLGSIVALWVGSAISGFTERQYAVLDPDAQVPLAGDSALVKCVAAIYAPHFYLQRNQVDKAHATYLWYEIIDRPNAYMIVYHPAWNDEIHPNKIAHWLYKLYRMGVYGIPSIDSEFYQVNVDKKDGRILEAKFEDKDRGKTFNSGSQKHILFKISYSDSTDSYSKEIFYERDIEKESNYRLQLNDSTHLKTGIVTWNHLFTLDIDSSFNKKVDFELRFLDNKSYKKMKFARKGQGDARSEEPAFSKSLGLIFAIAVLGIGFFVGKIFSKIH